MTELEKEKRRRIYYQDIVYAVCNALDELRTDSSMTVCGSLESPSTEVQDGMRRVVAEQQSDTMRVVAKALEGQSTVSIGKARLAAMKAVIQHFRRAHKMAPRVGPHPESYALCMAILMDADGEARDLLDEDGNDAKS